MTISVRLYRSIVVASLVFGILSAVTDVVFPQALPEPLSLAYDNMLKALPSGSMFLIVAGAIVLTGATIIATLGLCLFKPWARTLAIGTTVATVVLIPLTGPAVQSGWTSAFAFLSTVCWGSAIALAFSGTIGGQFAQTRQGPD